MKPSLVIVLIVTAAGCAAADFPVPADLATVGYCRELNELELAHLCERGLVVLTDEPETNLQKAYYNLQYEGVPIYVTADALLYLWYEAHRKALIAVEKQALRPKLAEFVSGMLAATERLREQGDDVLLQQNSVMLATVRKLLDPEWHVPEELTSEVTEEVAKVMEHTLVELYPGEDYTQYTVRGYYAQDEELASYFRATKYLARRYFRVADPQDEAAAGRELKRAALLALAMREGEGVADLHNEIYGLREFLVGPTDTIGLDQVIEAANTAWGEGWDRNAVGNINALQHELLKDRYRSTRIVTRVVDPYVHLPAQKHVAVLGEHYLPDSHLFQLTTEPVFDGRYLPTGLEVATALGLQTAADKLEWEARDFPGVVDTARKFDEKMSAEGVYGKWLQTLRALSDRPEGLPEFAKTTAYDDKQINCCLTSWSHLRHNYILYGAQTYSYLGITSGGGLVEPIPEFFSQYQVLCATLHDRLVELGIEGRVVGVLERLRAKAETFKRCAVDQLAGRDYSWARDDIHGFGAWIGSVFFDNPLVVADVATSSQLRSVLHAASGPFHRIIVLAEDEGEWLVAVGWVGSYYEFAKPNMQRLTDEQWKMKVAAEFARPQPPRWLADLYAPASAEEARVGARLRDIEEMLQAGQLDEGQQAVEEFIGEYCDTEWAPAAILLLGNHLRNSGEHEQAAEVLRRAEKMYGCDARDRALKLKQDCQAQAVKQQQLAERDRQLRQALAATAPQDGLSAAEEIERQNRRAEALLRRAAPDDYGGYDVNSTMLMEQLLEECPNSGYRPFAELALVFAHGPSLYEEGLKGREPTSPQQLREQFLALAEKYGASAIGHAARVAAASALFMDGQTSEAYEEVKALLDLDPPDLEPYPLAAEKLEQDAWDWNLAFACRFQPGIFAGQLMGEVMEALMVEMYAGGKLDLGLAQELIRLRPLYREGIFGHLEDIAVYVDYFADEPEVLRQWGAFHGPYFISSYPRSLSHELIQSARELADRYPNSKVAPAALYQAWEHMRSDREQMWDSDIGSDERSERVRIADELSERLAQDYPDSLEHMLVQCHGLVGARRYDEALALYDQVKQRFPVEAHFEEATYASKTADIDLNNIEQVKEGWAKAITSRRERFGAFLAEAGLEESFVSKFELGQTWGLVEALVGKLPDRELDILLAAEYLDLQSQLLTSVVERHADDPRVYELHWRLGQGWHRPLGHLFTIVAAGPGTPYFQDAVAAFETQVDEKRWPLRVAIALFQEAAEKYAGTSVEPLALAAVGRTYLKYERPERAVEFLEEAIKQIEEGRLFREKMVAALETARRQIVAKQGMVAKLLWEATVGAESRRDEPYLPLLAGDRLYVRGLTEMGGPGLLCLDSNSGEKLWEAATGDTVSTRLLDDSIVVSTSHGTIMLLDAATGEQHWRHEFGPRRIGKVVCDAAGQSIVAYWDQGLLCALQPDRGEIIWQQDLLTERPNLVSDEARLYHWDDDLRLCAVRLSDGTPVWTWDWRALLPEIELNGYRRGGYRRSQFGGPILRAGQVICKVYGEEPLLVALNPETGEVLWTTKPAMYLGRFVPAASSDEAQFTCAGYAGLHSYSSEDGSLLWSLSLGYSSDAAAVAAHFLLVPTLEGLLVLDRNRGELVGKSRELRFGQDRVFDNDPICRGIVAEEAKEGIRVYLVIAQTIQAWQLRVPRQ